MATKKLTTKSIKTLTTDYDGVTKNGKNFTKKLSYTDIENNWATYQNKVSVMRNILGLVGTKGIDFQYGKANTQKKGDLVEKIEGSKDKKLILDTYEMITGKDYSTFLESGYVANKIKNGKKNTVKKSSKKSTKSDLKSKLENFSKSELIEYLMSQK